MEIILLAQDFKSYSYNSILELEIDYTIIVPYLKQTHFIQQNTIIIKFTDLYCTAGVIFGLMFVFNEQLFLLC